MTDKTRLVIGIGNDFRGDDAAGLMVARRLRGTPLHDVEIVESAGDAAALMELWN